MFLYAMLFRKHLDKLFGMHPSPCSRPRDNFGTLTLKEKDEIESKFYKARGTRGTTQCFLDPTCKEIARGSLTAKDVWETLKNQLERKDSYTKTHLLTFLCTLSRKEALLTSIVASSQWKPSGEDKRSSSMKAFGEESSVNAVSPHLSGPREESWKLERISCPILPRLTCIKWVATQI